MFRSAVFKLTAAYVGIVMAISLVFSVVLYKLAVQELQLGFHNQYQRWYSEYQPFGLRLPGSPSVELAERSGNIFRQLAYFNILVFVLTAASSYSLARRTLRPIEAAHEQQKRFTADVSHELRTPLTAITMETEVALMDTAAKPKELRETLASNLEEAKRMEVLINNLLQLASLEANQIRTEFTRQDMQDIVETAVKVVQPYADKKSISLILKLRHADVSGSAPSLTQLCIILLENAVKYSPERSRITVSIAQQGGSVATEIRDQGNGIPDAALPHIFDRFYRADTSRSSTQEAGGFGLGLSLAKLIADVHDGEIIISSQAGKGTRATVELPVAAKARSKK